MHRIWTLLFIPSGHCSGGRREIARAKQELDLGDQALRGARVYEERDRADAQRGRAPRLTRGRAYEQGLRRREALMLVGRRFGGLAHLRILDLGCGFGRLLGQFRDAGVPEQNLVGVDLAQSRIEAARLLYPGVTFLHGNAAEIDLGDRMFDVAVMFTLMSSVRDDELATKILRATERVLAPNGAILWYDVRYPKPWEAHIRAMTKRRIRAIFSNYRLDLRSRSVLPPIADRLSVATPAVYPVLDTLPVLRTHYLGLLTPRAPGDRG